MLPRNNKKFVISRFFTASFLAPRKRKMKKAIYVRGKVSPFFPFTKSTTAAAGGGGMLVQPREL